MACNLTIRAVTCYRATNCASKMRVARTNNAQLGRGNLNLPSCRKPPNNAIRLAAEAARDSAAAKCTRSALCADVCRAREREEQS